MKAIGLLAPWQVERCFFNGAKACMNMNMVEQLLWNVERGGAIVSDMDGGQSFRRNGTCSVQFEQTPGVLNWEMTEAVTGNLEQTWDANREHW